MKAVGPQYVIVGVGRSVAAQILDFEILNEFEAPKIMAPKPENIEQNHPEILDPILRE